MHTLVPFPGQVGFGNCASLGGFGDHIVVMILDDDLSGSGQAGASGQSSGSSASVAGQSFSGSPTLSADGSSTLLAEGLSASGARVIADTTDTGEAQGLTSRSARRQTERSSSSPALLFIAFGAVLVVTLLMRWGAAWSGRSK